MQLQHNTYTALVSSTSFNVYNFYQQVQAYSQEYIHNEQCCNSINDENSQYEIANVTEDIAHKKQIWYSRLHLSTPAHQII
jgi:hypothetical protein